MRFDNYASSTASDLAARAHIIYKTDRISHALDLMEKHKVNQLLVTNEGEIFGVLTKKGIARTLGATGDIIKPASSLHVTKAVDETFTTVSGAQTTGEITLLMKSSEVLVVVCDQSTGQITINEILNSTKPVGSADEIMDPPVTCSAFRPSNPREANYDRRRCVVDDGR